MNAFLSDETFLNWVRAMLAQKCVRDGMIHLIQQHGHDLYSDSNKAVMAKCHSKYSCTNCDVDKLKKNRQPCPANGSCNVVYDCIKACHVHSSPNWHNTNCCRWSESAWEQMKCFIHTNGYKKHDIDGADITAIVQICRNYKQLSKLLGAFGVKVLEKVGDIRNELCHSATLQVSTGDLTDYFAHMKTCLKLKVFKNYKSEIKQQLEKLQDLENDHTEITLADVKIAILDVMKVSKLSNQAILNKLLQLFEVIESRAKTEDARFEEIKNMMLANESQQKANESIQKEILQVVSELKKIATVQPVNKVPTEDSEKALKPTVKVQKRKLAPEEHVRPVVKKFKKISSAIPIPEKIFTTVCDSYIDPYGRLVEVTSIRLI